jgi:ABC-type Na+ efflux pump permease subunit
MIFSLNVTDSSRAFAVFAAAAAAFAALAAGAFAAGAGFFDIDDIHGVLPTEAADCR